MKLDKDNIIKQYEESGQIMLDATLNGNYRRNNREGNKLLEIFKVFEQDRELARECIPELLKSENVVVRTKAAAYCLALNESVDVGESVLEEISRTPQYGIFRLNAEMTLKKWRENGELRLYIKE